jgi:hypothetical protein
MSTGKNWRVAAIAAGLAFTAFFTGCGGGDDEGDVGIVAPGSLAARSYNFSPNTGGQTAVSFVSDNNYNFMHENGAIEQGSYEAVLNGNTWTVALTSTAGGKQIYNMNFLNGTGGNFTLHRSEEEERTGTFSARESVIPSDPGPDPEPTTTGPTTTGPTTTGPSEEYIGFAPVSIAGREMQATRVFTSTGPNGQTHTYTFGNGTFHDSDPPEETDGVFTYNATNSRATLTLDYKSPREFFADKHQMTMVFQAKDRGTFESTYTRGDGTQIIINGTFEFTPIQ